MDSVTIDNNLIVKFPTPTTIPPFIFRFHTDQPVEIELVGEKGEVIKTTGAKVFELLKRGIEGR